MSSQTRSQQVVNVMRVLSSVPGGEEFELISKKYPQRTISGDLSCFEQQTHSYPLAEIESACVPTDADAISLVLHGTIQDAQLNPADQARELMFSSGLCSEWGYRTNHCKDNRFSLEVFPEDYRRPMEYW